MTQQQKILKLFERGGWVKVQEMQQIAWRYGSILFNLRKLNYVFEKRRQKDNRLEEWRLVSAPSTDRAFYPAEKAESIPSELNLQ